MGERVIAWLVRLVYGVCSCFPQRNKIVLLSRQSARPFDFALMEPDLVRRFPGYQICWCCVPEIGKLGPITMLKQLWHSATATLCLVDGYTPAISLPLHHRALVVQIWHAPGAIKKFGYQSLDTAAGHTTRVAQALRMHRGYDLIVAGMPGAVTAFSQAFDMPADHILPLGLPRIDYVRDPAFASLRARRYAKAEERVADAFARAGFDTAAAPDGRVTVLYAPTFRKGNADPQWLGRAVHALRSACAGMPVRMIVAGHPLDDPHPDADELSVPVAYLHGTPTIDLLHLADYVVTDYSTVAYEAGYAERRVLFYTPDIDEYRVSPGLNVDPLRDLPSISSANARAIARIIAGTEPYDDQAFHTFMKHSAGGVLDGSIGRIGAMLERELARSQQSNG